MRKLLRMEYGKNARRRAENMFDIEKVKRLYGVLYKWQN